MALKEDIEQASDLLPQLLHELAAEIGRALYGRVENSQRVANIVALQIIEERRGEIVCLSTRPSIDAEVHPTKRGSSGPLFLAYVADKVAAAIGNQDDARELANVAALAVGQAFAGEVIQFPMLEQYHLFLRDVQIGLNYTPANAVKLAKQFDISVKTARDRARAFRAWSQRELFRRAS